MGPFAPKLIKMAYLKDIQTLIVEHIIDQFLVTRCQTKRCKQGYDFLKEFLANNPLLWDEGPSKNRLVHSCEVLWIHVIDAIYIQIGTFLFLK